MAVEIAVEILRRGVFHALVQADDGGLLRDHVDENIGRQALAAVGQPLEKVGVFQIGHAHRPVVIVDLRIGRRDLELADHVAQLAQLAVAQTLGRVLVQHGDLVEGNLRHIGRKV